MDGNSILCTRISLLVLILLTLSTSRYVSAMSMNFDSEIQKLINLQSKMQLTVPELIEARGYPAEIHKVVTKDGYILEMHRIPHGIKNTIPTNGTRPAVFLMHFLIGSSANWIINSPDSSIGYILADSGYDVWMGNFRGNTYSKKHLYLPTSSDLFWQFSFAEIGKYDLPAMIDYVLNNTQQQKLYYVGFSMGTTIFFTMMHYHPEYNDKIRVMVALVPVAYNTNNNSILGALTSFVSIFEVLYRKTGLNELLRGGRLFDAIVPTLCSRASPLTASICSKFMTALVGPGLTPLNSDTLPVILSITPAGTSSRTLLHYLQNGRADRFQEYDHGFFGNIRHYGQATPPAYNLSKITAPVAVFYTERDLFVPPEDILRTSSKIPNVVLTFRVRNKLFSHLDFVWSQEAASEVYKPIMKVFERF